MPTILILATKNEGKVREIKTMIPSSGFTVKSFLDIHVPFEVEETEPTLEGNAMKKARAFFEAFKNEYKEFVVLSDDSGLEIDALNGAPGFISAMYAATLLNNPALSHNAEENMNHVLEKMRGDENRSAQFRTVVGIVGNTSEQGYFETFAEGIIKGTISESQQGNNHFGYDPIFIPEHANGRTFAQMSLEEKNILSHRGQAFRKTFNILSLIIYGKISH